MPNPFRPFSRRGRVAVVAALLAGVLVVAGGATAVIAGYVGGSPTQDFAAQGRARPVTALFFSGDMGLRWGMGKATAQALAAQGIPVLGINSSTLFATHRSGPETDAIVAAAVRQALARSANDRLVLIGQSFGADVMQTGLMHLPDALRSRIAGVILVVPGQKVFFRADPLEIAYKGTPDSLAAATLPALTWTPLTCVYGARENDSACPAIANANAWVMRMPGGHFLNNDTAALTEFVVSTIRRDVPEAFNHGN